MKKVRKVVTIYRCSICGKEDISRARLLMCEYRHYAYKLMELYPWISNYNFGLRIVKYFRIHNPKSLKNFKNHFVDKWVALYITRLDIPSKSSPDYIKNDIRGWYFPSESRAYSFIKDSKDSNWLLIHKLKRVHVM